MTDDSRPRVLTAEEIARKERIHESCGGCTDCQYLATIRALQSQLSSERAQNVADGLRMAAQACRAWASPGDMFARRIEALIPASTPPAALRPMPEEQFLKTSEGIPDYDGPDLEQRRASLAAGYAAIAAGAPTVSADDVDRMLSAAPARLDAPAAAHPASCRCQDCWQQGRWQDVDPARLDADRTAQQERESRLALAVQNRTRALMLAVVAKYDRESLGRFVRCVWCEWAAEQESPKPSWLVPWDFLDEPDKEVDRRIGEALYRIGRQVLDEDNNALRAKVERKEAALRKIEGACIAAARDSYLLLLDVRNIARAALDPKPEGK